MEQTLMNEGIVDAIKKYLAAKQDWNNRAAEADKKLEKACELYNKEIQSITDDHPVINGATKGAILGYLAGIPASLVVYGLIFKAFDNGKIGAAKLLLGTLGGVLGTQYASTAAGALAGSGVGLTVGKIREWIKQKFGTQSESLGERILEKLYRLTEEELEQGSEDSEAEGDDTQETSETLKKLRGHLYRFQEAEGESKHPLLKSMSLGAAAGGGIGAVAGNALGKHGFRKYFGAAGQAANQANTKAARLNVKASKSALNANDKALAGKIQAKMGQKTQANLSKKAANASAKTALIADKGARGAKAAGKAYTKAMNAAGRSAGWVGLQKGLKYGAGVGLAAHLGKKAYDHFKNK